MLQNYAKEVMLARLLANLFKGRCNTEIFRNLFEYKWLY